MFYVWLEHIAPPHFLFNFAFSVVNAFLKRANYAFFLSRYGYIDNPVSTNFMQDERKSLFLQWGGTTLEC